MEKQIRNKKRLLVDGKPPKKDPEHFIFFDTETKQKTENKNIGTKTYETIINTLDMGWICYWNTVTDQDEWFYFDNIPDFQKYIKSVFQRTKNKSVWMVAHNIVFDALITKLWDLFPQENYKTDFIHSKGMVFIQKMTNLKNRKSISLVNNGNIYPEKLENIGETVGLPKLEIDLKTSDRSDIKIYCKRDVEILLKFWRVWMSFIKTNKLGGIKYTISSQSMEAYRQRFCKSVIVLDDDLENLEFERKAYYGGRTEIFYKGIVRKPIYYYDVNAMYSFVMKQYSYPTKFVFKKEAPSIKYVSDMIDKGWLIIAECNIATVKNCYPVKDSSTLLFPIGNFKTYLATPEVVEGLENNDIVSFGRVSFYKGEKIFIDYVNFFYEFRLLLKSQNNKQEKLPKLLSNTLYGKFGQMTDTWENTTIEEIQKIDKNFDLNDWIMGDYKLPRIIMDGIDIMPQLRYIGEQLQISSKREETAMSFPAIAAHVTSYARLIIYNVMEYCKVNHIKGYYCDTDSIFTDQEIHADFIDNKELGKMKLEKIYQNGVEFINLKNYCPLNEDGLKNIISINEAGEHHKVNLDTETIIEDSKVLIQKGSEWKMKGVSESATVIDENTFIIQEWGGIDRQQYYIKFGRKSGEFWIILKQKINKNIIHKGDLDVEGNITPFVKEGVRL